MINNDDGKIRSRYDTLANWDNANPTLSKGEIGVAISGDDVKLKVGDGVTPWKTLPFISGGGGGSTVNVNWNDILGKPSTFTPSEHNHNDLYYTETEIDTKLGNKQNALNANQLNAVNSGITSTKVTQYDNYASNKQDTITDLATIRDGASKGATALQKHQDISGKADKATTLAGYGIENAYTKTETDNKLSGKANSTHTHVVNDITDFPTLATVAKSGSYNDLSDIPQEFNPPIATSTTLGGITVGDNLVVDENGKLSAIGGSSGLTIGDVYPVGSIYMSMVDTNPRLLFGIGEWERIGQGRTLIDCGEDYEAGSEGGEATHTITVDEIPSHNHTANSGDAGAHTPSGTVNGTTAGGTVNSYTLNGACYTTSTDKNAQILADTALSWTGIVSSYGNRTATTMSNTSSSYSFSSGFKVSASHGHTFTGTSHSHTFTGTAVSAHKHTITVDNSGGGNAMNNMQPYLAVYIWKRVS